MDISSPVQNPTAKARFMSVKAYVETHRSLMQRDDLQRALDYALLHYQGQLAINRQVDMASYATAGIKLQGVLEFIQTLKMLAETPQIPTPTIHDNLDHKA